MACTSCGKPIHGFKDNLSVTEYRITGFCQSCQDEVFEVCDYCGASLNPDGTCSQATVKANDTIICEEQLEDAMDEYFTQGPPDLD